MSRKNHNVLVGKRIVFFFLMSEVNNWAWEKILNKILSAAFLKLSKNKQSLIILYASSKNSSKAVFVYWNKNQPFLQDITFKVFKLKLKT